MKTFSKQNAPKNFQEHLTVLSNANLLTTIDHPINKDSELHPLVRWQFQGGLKEQDRRAFLFNNVVDYEGRRYEIPVAVGAYAASPAIYAAGLGVRIEDIGDVWVQGMANPIKPELVKTGPCQEIVLLKEDLQRSGGGMATLPVPISTPGFDAAPYLTATLVISKDPETGIQNMGTYRGMLKSQDRLGVRMAARLGGAGGYQHWLKYKERNQKMPVAIVVGCAPAILFTGPQKLPLNQDELAVAGGLIGQPVTSIKCKTVDLEVPSDSEIVIEGEISTDYLEPEGPFGESHGHVALEDFNMSMQITAITSKKKPVFASIISQVTPSESSVLKKVAYEPLYMSHLKSVLNIKGISGVVMHEPLTNIRKVIFLKFNRSAPQTEVWRGLHGAANLQAQCGKVVIAVSEDIDPNNADAVFWSIAYRSNINTDLSVTGYRSGGHGPKSGSGGSDGTLLIDATLKHDMPPLALPGKEYMERAREIWETLNLPSIAPQAPWYGYELGDWDQKWTEFAKQAVKGKWTENSTDSFERRVDGIKPETPTRNIKS